MHALCYLIGIPSPILSVNGFLNDLLFFEREREHKWGGAERERETQNPKQPPGSELSAQSPMCGSNS